MDVKRQKLKLYGERNTGTNYLSKLIELNIDATLLPGSAPTHVQAWEQLTPGQENKRDAYFQRNFTQHFGWKHRLVDPEECLEHAQHYPDELAFITLTKNPYSWLLSLHRQSQHHKKAPDFLTFLKTQWTTLERENSAPSFENPIELWNVKNAAYIALGKKLPTINLTYEELLASPETQIQKIRTHFNLNPSQSSFVNHVSSTKDKQKSFSDYQDYYLNLKWKEQLTKEAINIINHSLDDNTLSFYNYERITTLDR